MTPPISQNSETPFQRVQRIMSTDFDPGYPDPWTEAEFEEFARQEPLPPNQSASLPVEEQIELTI